MVGQSRDSLRCWCPCSAPLQQQKHQNKACATSAAKLSWEKGQSHFPQTSSIAISSPTDSHDTHKGSRKKIWGAESCSPGGSEYFSAGLSLGSSRSGLAYTSSGVQDEIGMQGKEQARAQAHPFQAAHQLPAHVNPYWHFSQAVPAGTSFC